MCSKCHHKYIIRTYGSSFPVIKVFQGDESAWEKAKEFFKEQLGHVELFQVLIGPKGTYEKKIISKGAYVGRQLSH